MSRHLQELTSENTRLRNSIIDVNDEVFSLRACMASVELEAKYNAEQELLHMQSELTFKVGTAATCCVVRTALWVLSKASID